MYTFYRNIDFIFSPPVDIDFRHPDLSPQFGRRPLFGVQVQRVRNATALHNMAFRILCIVPL
jgi:hypothetical protein